MTGSKEYKLTIAIPTYNRADFLNRCLESVISQKAESVEVIVSDNASTDNTISVMAEFSSRDSEIRCLGNDENIGPDRNFLKCLQEARGEYVLILSDDDMLLPGAVEAMLEALEGGPSLVHLNSCGILRAHPLKLSSPRIKEQGISVFGDPDAFFSRVGIYITYVSSLVFRREAIDAMPDKEAYFGTYFLQSFLALESLRHGEEYAIVNHCCVATTPNESISYDLYRVWGTSFRRLMLGEVVDCGIDPDLAMAVYKSSLLDYVLLFIAKYRPSGKDWDIGFLLSAVDDLPVYKVLFKAAIMLPKRVALPFAMMAIAIGRIMRKPKKREGLID